MNLWYIMVLLLLLSAIRLGANQNKGLVHAEYAEESVVLPHSTSSNGAAAIPPRQHKWQHILRERPRLAESIQAATGWRVEWIPNRCGRLRSCSQAGVHLA